VYEIAQCLYVLKKDGELLTMLEQVHKLVPNDPNIYMLHSMLAMRENKENIKKAIKYLRKVLELDSNNATAYYNLGLIFQKKQKYSIAKKMFEKSIEKLPQQGQSYSALGFIAKIQGEHDKEKKYYLQALEQDPNLPSAHANLGMHYLRKGEYEKAWPEYEWRLKTEGLRDIAIKYKKPCWQGESLAGKTLIIFAEQGFGDAIQFVRYIPLIDKQGGKIIFEVKAELIKLFQNVANIDEILLRDSVLPDYDYYFPLLSLPKIFETNANNIPCSIPYLKTNPAKRAYWHDYFESYANNLKVGIVWSGSAKHANDYYRSIAPSYFSQLNKIKNIKLFSLQKEATPETCAQYGFISLGQEFQDFSDTAACIAELDLVIAVDTAIIHLAGALNIPAWVLISFTHDWRWLEKRTDSPWYPSLKIYRQKKLGNWKPVFASIQKDLKKL